MMEIFKKPKTTRWQVLFAFLFATLFATSCAKKEVQIRFWHFWSEPTQSKVVKELIQKFEKENKCKVEITELSWNDGKTKLIAAFNSQTAPDVLELGSDWVAQFSSAMVLMELDTNEFSINQFLDYTLDPSFWNGRLFAIPWIVDTRVLFCNLDLMKQAGINRPPRTFDDLLNFSELINNLDGKYGFGANGSDPHRLYKKILPLIWSYGGDIVDSNNSINIYNIATIKAFELYFLLSRRGIIETQRQIDALFAQGKIGFCFSGSWLVDMIKNINPTINWTACTMPSPNPETIGISFAGGEYLAINKMTKNLELSKKLIKFLTDEPQILEFCSRVRQAGFPARKALAFHPKIISDTIRKVFALQLQHSRMSPVNPKWLEIEPILENALVEVLYQRQGTYEALKSAQRQIQGISKGLAF